MPNADASFPSDLAPIAVLGEGAFGRVVLAQDTGLGEVAVKLLAARLATDADAVWRFEEEFRRLERLRHPAFPRAIRRGRTADGTPYYVMEAIHGAAVGAAGALPAGQVRAHVAAIAEALAAVHALGWVHGDLKTENVLVTPEDRHVLVDVGLMAPVGQQREAIAGTLEYLAPEGWRRAPADPRADLYALGVLAYRLWTGALPFAGGPTDLARAHLHGAPPEAPALDADPVLARLVGTLLAKDPARRPASARGVLAALGLADDDDTAGGLAGGVFVGREAARTAWQAALAAGNTTWLGIEGPTGLGKTRLLDELRLEAVAAGRAWASHACLPDDGPAAAARGLVAGALAATGAEADTELAGWLAGNLPPAWQALEPAARKVLVYGRAVAALREAARAAGGLALGVDDWQHADAASHEFLAQARRELSTDALAAGRAGSPIAWAIAADETQPVAPVYNLVPFTTDEAMAVLAGRLGSPPPGALVDWILPLASGVPATLDALLEHAVGHGLLRPGRDGWRFEADRADLPADLADVWVRRWEALSPTAQRLAAAATLGAELPVAWLVEAADAGPEALETLMAGGWLVQAAGHVRPATPSLAVIAGGGADTRVRRTWCTNWSRRLVPGAPAAALPLDVLVRAAGLALGGDEVDHALTLAAAAAERTLALGAPQTAHALASAALARPDRPATHRALPALRLARAEAGRYLDRVAEAAEDYEAALAGLSSGEVQDSAGARRLAAVIGLAKCRQMQGNYDLAAELLGRAEALAADRGDTDQRARVVATLARLDIFAGRLAEAEARCEVATRLARDAGVAPVLAQVLTLHGTLRFQRDLGGEAEARAILDEALAISVAAGDRVGEGMAHDALGNLAMALGQLKEAAAAFRRFAEVCRQAGLATDGLMADLNGAVVAGEAGDAALAERLASGVATQARAIGRRFLLGAALAVIGQARELAGDATGAAEALDGALALALELKNAVLETLVRLVRLEGTLGRGRLAEAEAEASQLDALVARTGQAEAAGRLSARKAQLALLRGEQAEAVALARPLTAGHDRVAAHLAWQVLAAAASTPEERGEAAREALAIARAWEAPWHEAADRALLAECLAARGDEAGAREEARTVLDLAANPAAAARMAAIAASGPAPTGALDLERYAAWLEDLAAEGDGDRLAARALAAILDLARATRGYVLTFEAGRLREAHTVGLDYGRDVAESFSQSIAERALFTATPLYVVDASQDEAWRESASVAALGLRTVLALPLIAGETLLGVLYADREELEPLLSSVDVALLGALAATVAAALVSRREARQLAAERDARCRCLALARALARPDADVRAELLAAAREAVGADQAAWLERQKAAPAAWQVAKVVGASGDVPVSQGVADGVASEGRAVCLLDASESLDWQQGRSVEALGMRTVWCLPAGSTALVYLVADRLVEDDPGRGLTALEGLCDLALSWQVDGD